MEHKPHNALTEQELIIRAKLLRLENEDQKEDSHDLVSSRWNAFISFLGYYMFLF